MMSVNLPVPASTAGTAAAWPSSCSMPNQPPGRSSAAARTASGRITASPSAPPKTAAAGSCATSGGTRALRGTYGGLHRTRSTWPSSSASVAGSVASPATTVTGGSPACARADALRRNQSSASGACSTAYTRACGTSCATASAIAPEPLHKSTIMRALSFFAISTPQPASTSVSGRGTNTPGPTARSRCRNGAVPVRCCSGTRRARRRMSWSNRSRWAGVNSSTRASRPRGTFSTCAASSSASTRAESTPAADKTDAASASTR